MELSSLVSAFRNKAISPNLDDFQDRAIDLCGTGGDKAGSFNISTFVSFILAAGGVPVIKHGNRSISSKCGSADLLEAIGIPLQANSDILRAGLEELNFAFLFCSCIPSCIQAHCLSSQKFSGGWHHHDLQSFGTNAQSSQTQKPASRSFFPKDTWKRLGQHCRRTELKME